MDFDFDWLVDNDDDECDVDDLFEDPEDDLDKKLEAFPKTKAGMIQIWHFLHDECASPFEGWKFLWRESDFMDSDFRLMVAMYIILTFERSLIRFAIPDLLDWVERLKPELLVQSGNADMLSGISKRNLTMRELISKTLKTGELPETFTESDINRDVLKLAIGIDKYYKDWVYIDREDGLVAVYWTRSRLCGPGLHIRMEPRVDFVRKTDLKNFKHIEAYDDIVLRDIPKVNKIRDEEIAALIIAGARCIEGINITPKVRLVTMLDAQVPRVYENNAGFVAKHFLLRCLDPHEKRAKASQFRYTAGEELEISEMRAAIREVFLTNKITFYRALKNIYESMNA